MKWLELLVGAAAGVLSGCGVGGGTLLLLYLTVVANVPTATAAGVNLLYFLCCSPAALVGHIRRRMVSGRVFALTAAVGVIAAVAAAYGRVYLPTDWLRRGFGVLLLYIGVKSLFGKG